MSSIPTAADHRHNAPAIIFMPFGKVPNVTLTLSSRPPSKLVDDDEMYLAFQMLDQMLLERPFNEWEH